MEFNEFLINLADQFDDTELSELNAGTIFKDLEEWSSLTAMTIIAMAKTKYNKSITGREIRNCETIQDLFDLIKGK